MTFIITEPCLDIKDRACVEVCPVDCIYEGERFLYINPEECVDCQACEPVCPVEAIYPEDELPSSMAAYTSINADFFTTVTQLGTPGGAAAVGPIAADHPAISGLPRRETAS